MEELHAGVDDQSHYEISLTAGQAFVAFVLLLLSLAAAFAFGLMIGKGQADERLVVQKEPAVVTEASMTPAPKKNEGRIVELGVDDSDFQAPAKTDSATETAEPVATETTATTTVVATIAEDAPKPAADPAPVVTAPAQQPAQLKVATYAQLLSTSDQKVAETLAARLIDRGFTAAYVERGSSDKGPVYRVRVKFESEPEARAAEGKLREFSKDVWITTK